MRYLCQSMKVCQQYVKCKKCMRHTHVWINTSVCVYWNIYTLILKCLKGSLEGYIANH